MLLPRLSQGRAHFGASPPPSQPLLPLKAAISSLWQFGNTGNHSGVITSLLPWRSSLERSRWQLITPITSPHAELECPGLCAAAHHAARQLLAHLPPQGTHRPGSSPLGPHRVHWHGWVVVRTHWHQGHRARWYLKRCPTVSALLLQGCPTI